METADKKREDFDRPANRISGKNEGEGGERRKEEAEKKSKEEFGWVSQKKRKELEDEIERELLCLTRIRPVHGKYVRPVDGYYPKTYQDYKNPVKKDVGSSKIHHLNVPSACQELKVEKPYVYKQLRDVTMKKNRLGKELSGEGPDKFTDKNGNKWNWPHN